MIHGLFGSHLDFSYYLDDQTIVLNLEEFDSYRLTLEKVAKRIYTYLKSLPAASYHIVGYSLGGRIAFYLKYLDPIFFQKCICIGSKLTLHPEELVSKLVSQISWELSYAYLDSATFFKRWYAQPLFSSFDFDHHLEKRVAINKHFHQKCLNQLSILHQLDMETLLMPYQKQLLFLYGENDLPYKNYYENIKKIGYQVMGIKYSSHPVFLENPKETYKIIKRFFYDMY